VLDGFFSPRSVAVVGAARDPGKVGHFVFSALRAAGFRGTVYPVNPYAEEIDGVRCYASISDIPEPPDLAVVAVPATAVPGLIDECARIGTSSAIVLSAGFKETGPAGAALEKQVLNAAREGAVRILGPNCLGVVATHSGLNASFSASVPPAGSISFVSQSGALGTAILDWAGGAGIGINEFVSLGNRSDITEVDLIDRWADDRTTDVIVAYLESVADGDRFIAAAARASLLKPVIVLKAGTSEAGARAASSHTGSLSGSSVAYDAAFRRAGVLRAHTVEELFDFALAFSQARIPTGSGVAILTNAGGPAVLATDRCERHDLSLASFRSETIDRLREVLPAAASLYNPVDILGDASAQRYSDSVDAILADGSVSAILCIVTPQVMTDADAIAATIIERVSDSSTPLIGCFMGDTSVESARQALRDARIAQYPFPERAIDSLAAMVRYRAIASRGSQFAPSARVLDVARALIHSSSTERGTFITGQAAAKVVAACGIAVPAGDIATTADEAADLGAHIGYPVVAKIASPDILHKSDTGGIITGIGNESELRSAYDTVIGRARTLVSDAAILGVHVQSQIPPGREVIVGIDRDPTFGPMLMFGLGGVYVEALRDVVFRMCPVDHQEAREMIASIRSYPLLRGVRGEPAADLDALADVLVAISWLAAEIPLIEEIDINPLIVGAAGAGATAVDVRIGITGVAPVAKKGSKA
jgi:acetyltransferase